MAITSPWKKNASCLEEQRDTWIWWSRSSADSWKASVTGDNTEVRVIYSFIGGKGLNVKYIAGWPPAEPATNVLLTNCLKESVLKKYDVIYIKRDGWHWRNTFIREHKVTDYLKEVVLVKEDEAEFADVFFTIFHGNRGYLRQTGMYWSLINLWRFEPMVTTTGWNGQRCPGRNPDNKKRATPRRRWLVKRKEL